MTIKRCAFKRHPETSGCHNGILLSVRRADAMTTLVSILVFDGVHLMTNFVAMSSSNRRTHITS